MNQIEKYQGFRSELAIAETFEDIKIVESKAAAAAEFARRNKIGTDEQNQWGRFRVEIEAKKGEWLAKMFPHGGDRIASSQQSSLVEEGITFNESTNARLVAIEKELVEEVMGELEKEQQVITPSLVATKVRKKKKKKAVAKKVEEHKQETAEISDFDVDIFATDKKFNIIYADPAWKYWEGGEKNQSLHYNTMTIEEIKSLPVKNISAGDCILFLWVTFPVLKESFEVIESWGFKYSTCGFVWVKKNKTADSYFFGNGAWTRANTELCLIATKGSVTRIDASISQVIDDPISEHSEKPERVRGLITSLVGELPRIELFSRNKNQDGWFNWGNKI